ncbi:MAG: IS6 family transposase [Desulfobacteraceae bacterium]|nr:IS6 family transposase [Desulfobacteraceae bacterium]
MDPKNPFKWRHFEKEIILLNVRWYLRYALTYRDLEAMMLERGLKVAHSTIYRWVQAYAPEIEKRSRPKLRKTNDSYRVDETYIKVKGKWKYLYRAVDSQGNTIDFLFRAKRNKDAAKLFLKKMLKSGHTTAPRVITVDKNPSYPVAVKELKSERILSKDCEIRQIKYLNNIVEQDHRFIKRRVKPGLGFKSFHTAVRTLKGYEMMNMIRKGQIEGIKKGEIEKQIKFIDNLFALAA